MSKSALLVHKRDFLLSREAMQEAHDMSRRLHDAVGIVGFGIGEMFDGDGRLKSVFPFANTITDAGDTYYAGKAIVGIAPASASAPTAANGMKLGTGTTAINKAAGTGIALTTYKTGTNVAFDTSGGPYPLTSALGTNLGTLAVYKTTFIAGVGTDATGLTEAVIVNDRATDATTTAPNTYSRVVYTAQVKGASDVFAITWNHKFLGT